MNVCPYCKAENPSDAGFCTNCGKALNSDGMTASATQRTCPVCGAAVGQDYFACMNCGADLLSPDVAQKDNKLGAFNVNFHELLQHRFSEYAATKNETQ